MVEPEKRDQNDSVGPGLVVFTVLFILAFLALAIFVQNNPGNGLAFFFRLCWVLFACYVLLWWIPKGIIKFFKRRIDERRFRAERDAGLNGPSRQR